MKVDESKIKKLLESKSCFVQRIKEASYRTPEFKVQKDDVTFYCEVKSISDDEWEEGLRNDPTFNALSNKIHEAFKQFEAVNLNEEFSNVLVFCNHRGGIDARDLQSTLTGCFYADDGTVHKIYGAHSDGRIKAEKQKISLYVWITEEDKIVALYSNEQGKLIASTVFGLNIRDDL